MKFPILPQDKANHFVYGSIVAAAAPSLFLAFGGQVTWVPILALTSALVAGVLKEVMDYKANKIADKELQVRPHTIEPLDVAWTAAGGISAALVSWRVLVALGF